ncbi:MAG: hypothetical protein JW958_11660 [Candidatus Eisenbacteria bacterium]|nr:hypothetical protein [Candidatus Eisenbacteria bacterium]
MYRSRSVRPVALALFLAAAAFFATSATSADPVHQKIRLPWPTAEESAVVRSIPDLEVMGIQPGSSITLLSTPELTAALEEAGLRPEILVDPYGAFHLVSEGRAWAGLGDFISYDEAVVFLDSMHTLYPAITTAKDSIGTTWEGRTIWAIKISDNPNVDEEEPELLIDALHHAREPIGVSVVCSFISHLCDNYGGDEEATFLVDEREIWVIPVVNPDGYVYNETVSSDLLWRKNRRDNPGEDEGVDLNRNYDANFGGAGSSSTYRDQTYHGPYAFSEPETQAMRDFILGRNFVTHDSYHSVASAILYPWGYLSSPTADDFAFSGLGLERSRDNGYDVSQIYYFDVVSGSTCDWAYATKEVISFATEVGGSHFWPQESEIPGLVAENLYSNLTLAWNAGSRARLAGAEADPSGNGRLDPGETADLVLSIENPGYVVGAEDVRVVLSSDNAYLQLLDAAADFGNIAVRESADNAADPFSVAVDEAAPSGTAAEILVRIEWDGGLLWEETLSLTIGESTVIVSDDFESGNAGWSADPIQDASTGAFVLIDPNATDYQPGDDHTPAPGTVAWVTGQNTSVGADDVDGGTAAIRSPVWDLSGRDRVRLSLAWFHGQRDAGDDAADGFAVEISDDGGATFPEALVSIGDVYNEAAWSVLEADLHDVISLTDQVVLRVRTADGASTGDIIEAGFDDLVLVDLGPDDDPPGAPAPLSPADGGVALPAALLTVQNAVDPEGGPLTYGFFVYADSLFTDRARVVTGIAEGSGETSWAVNPPLPDGDYWWRAFAEDSLRRGPLSAARRFTVDQATGAGEAGAAPAFALLPARPNPSRDDAVIRFILPREGRVRADVFDASGRAIRNLVRGRLSAGPQALLWDGRDSRGRTTPAGVYFVRLRTEREERAIKIVRIR